MNWLQPTSMIATVVVGRWMQLNRFPITCIANRSRISKRAKPESGKNLKPEFPKHQHLIFGVKESQYLFLWPWPEWCCFFLLVGGIFVVSNLANGYNNDVSAIAAEESRQTEVLMTDLEMVTRYMESQNDIIEVTMQLPEESRFYFSGEPRLIREQDFKNSRQ